MIMFGPMELLILLIIGTFFVGALIAIVVLIRKDKS